MTVTPPDNHSQKSRLFFAILQIVVVVAIFGGGIFLAAHLLKTGPEAKPRKFVPSPTFVKVTSVAYGPYHLSVQGMGTVVPAREIDLTAGVGGEVMETSPQFVPGGFFQKDQPLLRIDPTDLSLDLRQRESEVLIAQNELTAEMGNQRIARKEFSLLGQMVSDEEKLLMLRQPQLATREANLQTAKAKLAQVERDLERTQVVAPFNAVVKNQKVDKGSRVTATTPLATMTGTDEFWIKLLVPVTQLKWLVFPEDNVKKQASSVKIHLQSDGNDTASRQGRLYKLAPDLEEQGRMAVVYVSVPDPLCLTPENEGKPKLLLGSYVRAVIEGTELASVLPIPRSYLRDNNTVWLMDEASKLEIREVEIIARTQDQVLITGGIKEGEKLITSNLSAPVAGTLVKLMGTGKNNKSGTDNLTADATRELKKANDEVRQ